VLSIRLSAQIILSSIGTSRLAAKPYHTEKRPSYQEEEDTVQRRRRPKNEPKNIFDKSSGSRTPKSDKSKHLPSPIPKVGPQQITAPPPVVGASNNQPLPPDVQTLDSAESVTDISPESGENESETILEDQILGKTTRRSRGLILKDEKSSTDEEDSLPKTSKRATKIIEASKVRAAATTVAARNSRLAAPASTATKPPVRKPRRRRIKPSFQPATRERRLDRSRHMEYKYEVRSLLIKLDVAEEFRSSILGSIWAKGERQTSEAAREYIRQKESEGVLSTDQTDRLIAVVDDYTIRR